MRSRIGGAWWGETQGLGCDVGVDVCTDAAAVAGDRTETARKRGSGCRRQRKMKREAIRAERCAHILLFHFGGENDEADGYYAPAERLMRLVLASCGFMITASS